VVEGHKPKLTMLAHPRLQKRHHFVVLSFTD